MIKVPKGQTSTNLYEILDYILMPELACIDTGLPVDGTMTAEMTLDLGPTIHPNANSRIFSNNGTEQYGPQGGDWDSPYTWGLQLEDNATELSVAPFGYSGVVERVGVSVNALQGIKLRYNLTAGGDLNVYYDDDTVFLSTQISSDTTISSSPTNLCMFSMGTEVPDCYFYEDSKYYGSKVWTNNSLVRNYVPAKRLEDNVVGLYDLVNDTFSPNIYNPFTGVSKATPEYITGIVDNTINVEKIKVGDKNICRIYNRGKLYFGIEETPTPVWHGIRGTANVTSTTLQNAIYYNGSTHNIDVDANGNWEIEENNYIYDTYRFSRSNNITSIDFRNTIWGTYPNTAAGVSPLSGMFDNGGRYNNLRDVYFDFTGQDTQNIIVKGSLFRNLNNCSIHGLGTFVWSGEFTSATPGAEDFTHLFTFREHTVNSPSIVGTYDIRGIDTTGLTDMDESQIYKYYRPTYNYGNWTHYANGNYCTTWIIGKFEIHFLGSLGGCSRCTTLYCTSPTPPSLNRTGTYGIHALNWMTYFTSLQNIYVPVGHLSDYTNASVWSNYASLMSEQDAPDPLSI